MLICTARPPRSNPVTTKAANTIRSLLWPTVCAVLPVEVRGDLRAERGVPPVPSRRLLGSLESCMTCAPEPRRPRAPIGLSPPVGLRRRKFSGVPRTASPSRVEARVVLSRLPSLLFLPIGFSILPVSNVNLHVRAARLPHLQ